MSGKCQYESESILKNGALADLDEQQRRSIPGCGLEESWSRTSIQELGLTDALEIDEPAINQPPVSQVKRALSGTRHQALAPMATTPRLSRGLHKHRSGQSSERRLL